MFKVPALWKRFKKGIQKQPRKQLRFQEALGGLQGSIFKPFGGRFWGRKLLQTGVRNTAGIVMFFRGPKVEQVPATEAPPSAAQPRPARPGLPGRGREGVYLLIR